MEFYNDTFLFHLMGLENALDTHNDKITSDTIAQTKQRLNSIMLRLNSIHNSRLPINKVVPDILHNIFVLAVQTSPPLIPPGTTAIRISSVCRHWRTCALEWSTLWSFIDLLYPRPMLDLFMTRTRDVPFATRWSSQRLNFIRDFHMVTSTIPYIFSRSSSLTLHLFNNDIDIIRRILKTSKSAPLQLQCLHSLMLKGSAEVYDRVGPIILTDYLPVDISRLRELKMRELHLPWLSLPSNRLTHLSLTYQFKYPDLSKLLVFLSTCPLLKDLELNMLNPYADCDEDDDRDDDDEEEEEEEDIVVDDEEEPPDFAVAATLSINGLPIAQLNFHNLKNLVLNTHGRKGYHYIREFSAWVCAPDVTQLRRYCGDYAYIVSYRNDPSLSYNSPLPHFTTPFNIFESIPSGTQSSPQFAGLSYLSMNLPKYRGFKICAGYGRSSAYNPLDISGEIYGTLNLKFDHSPIIELIRAMPKLTHLSLCPSAWSIFTSMSDTEIRTLFPCLHTLELSDCQKTKLLNSPLLGYLKPETLILDTFEGISSDDNSFLDAVLKIRVKVLIVQKRNYDEARDSGFINVLLTKGIRVCFE